MKIYKTLILLLISFNSLATEDFFYLKISNGEKIKITTNDLEKMPLNDITTSTNFTERSTFSGVRLSYLIKKHHISSASIRVFAWDDYSYTIPVDEILKYKVIIAFKKNGSYMPISDLGPYAIIYPRDDNPELINLDVNARTVWQIKEILAK